MALADYPVLGSVANANGPIFSTLPSFVPIMVESISMEKPDRSKIFVKLRKFGDEDKKMDYEYWSTVEHEFKFQAAWDLVVQAHTIKGGTADELRFQRSVAKLVRRAS